MDHPSLQKLVDQACNGNADAWERLFETCQPHLLSDAQRLLGRDWPSISPRDLTQETWLKAKRALASYRGAGFLAWLSSIMRNVHRNLVRGQRGRHEKRRLSLAIVGETDASVTALPSFEPVATETSSLHTLVNQEEAAQLHAALAALDPELRQILQMSVDDHGLSLTQIGARLHLTPKEVRTRYHRGLGQLRRKLQELSR